MSPSPTHLSRRALLRAGAGAGLAAVASRAAVPSSAAAQDAAPATPAPSISRGRTKLVVLGSHGGQQMTELAGADVRCGTSFVVAVDGRPLVIDCGVGSLHALVEAGFDANTVRTILVTHLHADHIADLGSFALLGWASGRNGGSSSRRMDIYGPPGLRGFRDGIIKAFATSIADQQGPLRQRPTFRRFARWHEIGLPRDPKTVVSSGGIRVQAARVKHGGMKALAYRLKTPDLDIVFSGDRGKSGDRFARLAKGADVMVHEVIARKIVVDTLTMQKVAKSFIDHLVDDHTDVADVGRIATAAGVKTLVLSHLIPGNPGLTDQMWIDMVRPTFAGEIIVARDGQVL